MQYEHEIDCVGWLPSREPEGDIDPVQALPAFDEFVLSPAQYIEVEGAMNV